ncbi:MAG TPA: PAS domain S-box protein [Polyangiaceae bacterium]|nr:PAS domain S-box protein [Polyangiaceae bacterium]
MDNFSAVVLSIDPLLGSNFPYVSFFVATAAVAYLATPLATTLTVVLGFGLANWCFIHPQQTFWLGSRADVIGALSYFVASAFIALITHRAARAKALAEAGALESARRQKQVEAEIADRRRVEEALRESESRYRTLVDVSPDAVIVHQDRRIVFVNPAGLRLCCASTPSQLLGKDILGLVHESERDALGRELETRRTGVYVETREFRLIALDESEVIAEARAVATEFRGRRAVQVVIRDVTSRRHAESALRESEARFRHLTQAIPGLLYDVDAEGRTGYFNRRWLEYTGYEAGDMEARISFLHPDDRAGMRAAWSQAVKSKSEYTCEYRLRRYDGEYRWHLARAVPTLNDHGNAARWYGVSFDVHELKMAQQALREADKNKSAFLAVLSHELRNPLTPISISLHILERTAPASEQARRAVAVAQRQVRHLTDLVDGLLDLTRISRNKIHLERDVLDLNQLLERTIEDHRELFRRNGIELQFTNSPEPLMINGDSKRLTEVFGSLLQNAAKFTPTGGRTNVSIAAEPSTGEAVVRLEDSGVGMSQSILLRLFQPFVQADSSLDRSKGGLGLGLALGKGLIELHEGRVEGSSPGLGHGSAFTVFLPLHHPDPQVPIPSQVIVPPVRRRVLIVEDNVDAANSLREALELCEHQVEVAYDAPAGLVKAREFRPDIILCDLGLPGMDGYEFARNVRADDVLKGTYLTAVSGYAREEDLQRAHEAGFDKHLAKPPDLARLSEIMAVAPSRTAEA